MDLRRPVGEEGGSESYVLHCAAMMNSRCPCMCPYVWCSYMDHCWRCWTRPGRMDRSMHSRARDDDGVVHVRPGLPPPPIRGLGAGGMHDSDLHVRQCPRRPMSPSCAPGHVSDSDSDSAWPSDPPQCKQAALLPLSPVRIACFRHRPSFLAPK